MKIETKRTMTFYPNVLDAFQNKPDVKSAVVNNLLKQLAECFEESLSEVVRLRKYLGSDRVEVSVAVEIGDPDEDNEVSIEEYDEE